MPPRKAGGRASKPAHRKGKSARAKSVHGKSQRKSAHRWSARVTPSSDALDLKRGVFSLKDPKRIAASLKRSAERSKRKKSGSYRSALSMLTFYINRAGKSLSAGRRKTLQRTKDELRKQFGRP
jgi:hypothetical protein